MFKVNHVHENIIQRALDVNGTCTGEHGVGYGKMKYLTKQITQTYSPKTKQTSTDWYDTVLWREVWTLGGVEIKVQLHQEPKVKFLSYTELEEFDVTMQVGVDYQWYHLTHPNFVNWRRYECCRLETIPWLEDNDQYKIEQHWREEDNHLFVKGPLGEQALSWDGPGHNIKALPLKAFSLSSTWNIFPDGRIQSERGECLHVGVMFMPAHCDHGTKWSFTPVPLHYADDESSSIV